jgi:hypothetical protein
MVPYDAQLKSHYLAYELLKRKLRISYVHQVTKSIKVEDLRNIYKNIHRGLKPSSGMLPGIERFALKLIFQRCCLLGISFVTCFRIIAVSADLTLKFVLPISLKRGLSRKHSKLVWQSYPIAKNVMATPLSFITASFR